jgi:hypothetical protein
MADEGGSGRLSRYIIPSAVSTRTKNVNREILAKEGALRVTKFIFKRQKQPDGSVKVEASYETDLPSVKAKKGLLANITFADGTLWGKFIGALQHGALQIPDLEIELVAITPAETIAGGGDAGAAVKLNPK